MKYLFSMRNNYLSTSKAIPQTNMTFQYKQLMDIHFYYYWPKGETLNMFLIATYMLVALVTIFCSITWLTQEDRSKKKKIIIISCSLAVIFVWFIIAMRAALDGIYSDKLRDPCGIDREAFHLVCRRNLIMDHIKWCSKTFEQTYAYCQRLH